MPVLNYDANLHEYHGRPEHKALGPDGQPYGPPIVEVAPDTAGDR